MTNHEKGLAFERKCYDKLDSIGFTNLKLTKPTDNGADIVGTYKGTTYVFQCKDEEKKQGNTCVQQVVSARRLYKGNKSVVISKSSFTQAAIVLAKANNCILIHASDFFQLTDFPPQNYSDMFNDNFDFYNVEYDVLQEYEKIKKSFERTPKWDELDKHLKNKIRKKYKNYGNFLSTIGDSKFNQKPSDDEIKREYWRIKKLLNKIPTLQDIKNNSTFSANIFKEYPFTKLQKECGDRPHIERGVSKETLKEAYFRLERQLKHPPTVAEIDKLGEYRASYYRNRWKTMDSFLSDVGRSRVEAGLPKVYTNEEIISIYSLLKILLALIKENNNFVVNHTVLEKAKIGGEVIISPSTISKHFGGWENFMKYVEQNNIDNAIVKLVEYIRKDGLETLLMKFLNEHN